MRRLRARRFLFLAAPLCLAAGPSWAVEIEHSAQTFSIETVDGLPGDHGGSASLAVDGHGNLHVAYADAANESRPAYAVKSAGAWSPRRVIEAVPIGGSSSIRLALDGADGPHVAYRDAAAQRLKYAESDDGGRSWKAETADTEGSPGSMPAIAVGPSGRVVVAYDDEKNGKLVCLRRAATAGEGHWSWVPLDFGGFADVGLSIAIDSTDRVWAAYEDPPGTRKLARYGPGAKDPSVEVNPYRWDANASRFAALALDGAGRAHQVVGDDGSYTRVYRGPETWDLVPIDESGGAWSASIAVDRDGVDWIAYVQRRPEGGDDLRLARIGAEKMTLYAVDAGEGPGLGADGPSIALDGRGDLHIAYHFTRPGGGELRVAHWPGAGAFPPAGYRPVGPGVGSKRALTLAGYLLGVPLAVVALYLILPAGFFEDGLEDVGRALRGSPLYRDLVPAHRVGSAMGLLASGMPDLSRLRRSADHVLADDAAPWAVMGALFLVDGLLLGQGMLTLFVGSVLVLAQAARRRAGQAGLCLAGTLALLAFIAANDRVAAARALRVAAACRDYKAKNGRLPAALEDLVPGFLPKVPVAKYTMLQNRFRYNGAAVVWTSVPPAGESFIEVVSGREGFTD